MLCLVAPSQRYLRSYADAFNESDAHSITSYPFSNPNICDVFEKFNNYRHERNLKPGRVGAHYFWLVDSQRDYFIGEIVIRHKLTESLEKYGGHIGYGVRFSEWNKGYGSLMLKLALPEAQKIGLTRILITCDDTNIASARVMEKNGFTLIDKLENFVNDAPVITRRYQKEL